MNWSYKIQTPVLSVILTSTYVLMIISKNSLTLTSLSGNDLTCKTDLGLFSFPSAHSLLRGLCKNKQGEAGSGEGRWIC